MHVLTSMHAAACTLLSESLRFSALPADLKYHIIYIYTFLILDTQINNAVY